MSKTFTPGKSYIPASGPVIDEDEYRELAHVLSREWFTEGKACKEFQDALSKETGQEFVELCNSGSSADLLALSALVDRNIHNKYIVTGAIGFPTTISPIYFNNQIPLYIDIDPKTFSPSMGHLQYVLETPEYKDNIIGAVLTHMLGFPYDEKLAKELLGQDKWLVSDCCDCLGGKIYGEPVGTFSDVSTYSFFPAHHITTIEGGAVCTNNPAIAKKIHSLNNWGRDCFCRPGQQNVCGKRFEQEFDGLPAGWDHKYTFTNLGYNFKMTEFQAAFGIAQMRKLNGFVDRRIENLWSLLERLDDYVAWLDFVELPEYSSSSPFGFPITVTTNEFTAQNLIAFLEKNKIATRRMFGGNLARQPAFKNLPYIYCGFDGADYVMNRTFWIGCHPGITNEMLDYIEEIFGEFFKQYE